MYSCLSRIVSGLATWDNSFSIGNTSRCLFLMQLEKKALMLSCAYLTSAGSFPFARLTTYAMANRPQSTVSCCYCTRTTITFGFFVGCPHRALSWHWISSKRSPGSRLSKYWILAPLKLDVAQCFRWLSKWSWMVPSRCGCKNSES